MKNVQKNAVFLWFSERSELTMLCVVLAKTKLQHEGETSGEYPSLFYIILVGQ